MSNYRYFSMCLFTDFEDNLFDGDASEINIKSLQL